VVSIPKLGGDEKFRTWNTRLLNVVLDGTSDCLLVEVTSGYRIE